MKKTLFYELDSVYRDSMRIYGYEFGEGEEAFCAVGSMRGNEVQQLYTCGLLIQRLKEAEKKGLLIEGKKLLVIPCLNSYSMNIGKRFWTTDNSDINRMFPGYNEGETTQRIASGIFEVVKKYQYGVQFASFYMRGEFLAHIRMMETGFEDVETAKAFEFPYIVLRKTRPFDTTTLNYNWQIWNVKAFSIYTTTTEQIDKKSAEEAIAGIFRLLWKKGMIRQEIKKEGIEGESIKEKEKENGKRESRVVDDSHLTTIRCRTAGMYEAKASIGEIVFSGQILAEIFNTFDGEVQERLTAPVNGRVFFLHTDPLVYANTAVIKLVSS